MKQEKWDGMSNKEKYAYLKSLPITVQDRVGLDGSAKVGDPNAVKTYFTAYCGEVQVSHTQLTAKEALDEADKTIAGWGEPEEEQEK